jgi:hypothetical protein
MLLVVRSLERKKLHQNRDNWSFIFAEVSRNTNSESWIVNPTQPKMIQTLCGWFPRRQQKTYVDLDTVLDRAPAEGNRSIYVLHSWFSKPSWISWYKIVSTATGNHCRRWRCFFFRKAHSAHGTAVVKIFDFERRPEQTSMPLSAPWFSPDSLHLSRYLFAE